MPRNIKQIVAFNTQNIKVKNLVTLLSLPARHLLPATQPTCASSSPAAVPAAHRCRRLPPASQFDHSIASTVAAVESVPLSEVALRVTMCGVLCRWEIVNVCIDTARCELGNWGLLELLPGHIRRCFFVV
ncbi:hypothetical protein GOP47_0007147 [Adiantum capillus-veneris]|uniref:Uncharacterized protein n=1 Tax=Adiantum capillus-veneris TaxID=13818 RepID=A0A9D4V0C3_ADICA|nr:hypothetical protein GOP47_0007147 [Adiantum capillus-veneris]